VQDRNGEANLAITDPLTPEVVINSPLCFDDPTSLELPTYSLRDLHVELKENPVSFTKTPVDLHKSTRGAHQRHDFVPKKYLEDVLDKLKGKVSVIPNPGKEVVDINEIKTEKQGKHKTHRVPDIDFRNKRNDQILSRMVRNQHHNCEKPIPIIDVEDRIYVDDTNIDLPQYDVVSNLPPFLKEQEGFSGIQYDLKRIME
jgi:hypothetical protein